MTLLSGSSKMLSAVSEKLLTARFCFVLPLCDIKFSMFLLSVCLCRRAWLGFLFLFTCVVKIAGVVCMISD